MASSIGRVATALSDGAWLDAGRARAYTRILLALTLLGAVGWTALSSGGLDREGKPIGTDFVGFYAASGLALDGRPELAYDVSAHWAAQRALFGPKLGYTAFFYPPPALLISLPLALAPYFWSLAAWLTTTGYAFYRVLRMYLPSLEPAAFLAFPAVFVNAAHGQNGFLSAALIGGGLLTRDRRPVLAGVLLGAMAFKPHLALVIPFALVFARRWTTLIVSALTAAAFSAASLAAFGAPAWSGFLPMPGSPARRWRIISSATRRCRACSQRSGCCMDRSRSPGELRLRRRSASSLRSGGLSGAPFGRARKLPPSSAPACSQAHSCSTTI